MSAINGGLADRAVPVTIETSDRVWDGFRPVDLLRHRHETPAGDTSPALSHEVLRGRRVVAVIPYDPARDEIVLLRQFRLAAHIAHGRGELIEIPAGGVDPDEDLAVAARRELAEETGLVASDLVPAVSALPSPGSTVEYFDLFLARVDAATRRGVAGLHHEGEVIATHAVPAAEAFRAARSGAMTNGYALLALFWFEGVHGVWRARWR